MSGWRDTTCGALTTGDVGRRVTLAGWVDTRRDHGGLVFIDLRDFSGKVQLVLNPATRSSIPAATLARVDSLGALMKAGKLHVEGTARSQ